MEREEVCYTREAALEKAVEMEARSFEAYKGAYFRIKDARARDLVRDLALDELRHKYILEKAFFEDSVMLHASGSSHGPSMKLTVFLRDVTLEAGASDQDIMVHAIHDKKRAADFYRGMAEQCGGAPMEEMFKTLSEDEEGHLARLEDLYEGLYMADM